MSTNLTPQQISFIEAVKSKSSTGLNALAGSGKTFSLQLAAQAIPGTGMSTSFSKSTVVELGKKMPTRFPSRTLHGTGKDAISRSGNYKKIDSNKVGTIVKALCNERDLEWNLISPTCQLVSQAKTAGIAPGRETALLPDTQENWETLAEQFDISFSPDIHALARDALIKSNEISLKEGIIDFDDMLYISLLWPHRFSRYETVIVDEAQDLNALQHLMVGRTLFPGGRIIAAGDPNQAIYAFRGALHNSYEALISQFSAREMPLTVSFRCPRAVVLEAQQYVPEIEAAPGAIEGEVIHHDRLEIQQIPHTVLCRNNAPLIRLALKCLSNGMSAEVAGKDIGLGLVSLSKRIATGRNSDSMSIPDFLARLDTWAEREISRKPRTRARVEDKVLSFEALAAAHTTLGGLRKHLTQLYVNPEDNSRRPADIYLSTIHRAKGREWPHVLFLDSHLLPSKYAEQEWELRQERNLSYVGVTRAQVSLHYCNSDYIEG